MPASVRKDDDEERDPIFWHPEDVPPDLDPLDRAIIAARQIRLWADWLLSTRPEPPKSEELIQSTQGEGTA